MKAYALIVTLSLALSGSASPYFDNITNLWWQGHQTNVLSLAELRLSSNSNDVAGLLMKASYDFDFADSETLSNSLVRVLQAGESVTTPAFTNWFWRTQIDIRCTFRTLAKETATQHAADMLKVQGAGHPMAYEDDLKALDDDGYFNP